MVKRDFDCVVFHHTDIQNFLILLFELKSTSESFRTQKNI